MNKADTVAQMRSDISYFSTLCTHNGVEISFETRHRHTHLDCYRFSYHMVELSKYGYRLKRTNKYYDKFKNSKNTFLISFLNLLDSEGETLDNRFHFLLNYDNNYKPIFFDYFSLIKFIGKETELVYRAPFLNWFKNLSHVTKLNFIAQYNEKYIDLHRELYSGRAYDTYVNWILLEIIKAINEYKSISKETPLVNYKIDLIYNGIDYTLKLKGPKFYIDLFTDDFCNFSPLDYDINYNPE